MRQAILLSVKAVTHSGQHRLKVQHSLSQQSLTTCMMDRNEYKRKQQRATVTPTLMSSEGPSTSDTAAPATPPAMGTATDSGTALGPHHLCCC